MKRREINRRLAIRVVAIGQLVLLVGGVLWLTGALRSDLASLVGGGGVAAPDVIVPDADRIVSVLRIVGIMVSVLVSGVTFAVASAVPELAPASPEKREVPARADDIEREGPACVSAVARTRDAVIFGLAKLAESRDADAEHHLDRMKAYVSLLARRIQQLDDSLTDAKIEAIVQASALHDIGKVGVPDAVLFKPGRLTEDERRLIERHPLIGGDCLLAIKKRVGGDAFLEMACEIAFAHHERWDGAGYPFGLSGEDIPLPARIVAVADVYDALTTRRVYKEAISHEQAKDIVLAGAGKQFDPLVVEAFAAEASEFAAVVNMYGQCHDVSEPVESPESATATELVAQRV